MTKRHGSVGFSEEQESLLESATQYCRDKSDIDTVRRLIEDDTGHEPKVFEEVAELGWLGIAVPETFGGAGLELAEVVPVVEQMGRRLMGGPFLSTTLVAQALLTGGTPEQQKTVLPQLVAGAPASLALLEGQGGWDLGEPTCRAKRSGTTLTLSGTKTLVVDGAGARWIVASVALEGASGLVLLDEEAIGRCTRRRETLIDETRRSVQLQLDGVEVAEIALLDPARVEATLARLELAGALLAAAEMCGGGVACIEHTVEYLNARKQFGRPIGSYQALKHPTVHAHLGIEQARSHLYAAAHTFERGVEGEIAVRMAKAQVGPAFAFAADRAIQFHGGYGFTYECDAQLYRRRAHWGEAQFGDALHHRRKLADLMF